MSPCLFIVSEAQLEHGQEVLGDRFREPLSARAGFAADLFGGQSGLLLAPAPGQRPQEHDALRARPRWCASGRRRWARETSALNLELFASLQEARLRLRLDRDPAAALKVLDPVDQHPITHGVGFLGPPVDSWYGYALLLQGRDADAPERLRRSVTTELRTGRMLDMPTTAVYLAEAEWRMGNEDAADRAADLALEAARIQG